MGGKTADRLVSLLDLPKTIVTAAGADSTGMRGEPLQDVFTAPEWKREVYIQISESYIGRAVRTERYTYCVYAPDKNPNTESSAKEYTERCLFDNKQDPDQKNNLIHIADHDNIKTRLKERLITLAGEAGEGEISIKAGI